MIFHFSSWHHSENEICLSHCFLLPFHNHQITLQCCSGFTFPTFREMSSSALTFSSKLLVFHAMQHRFYAGSNDPLSRERFRHLQYRSALASQVFFFNFEVGFQIFQIKQCYFIMEYDPNIDYHNLKSRSHLSYLILVLDNPFMYHPGIIKGRDAFTLWTFKW